MEVQKLQSELQCLRMENLSLKRCIRNLEDRIHILEQEFVNEIVDNNHHLESNESLFDDPSESISHLKCSECNDSRPCEKICTDCYSVVHITCQVKHIQTMNQK